jgi:hypothetical protein
MRRRAARSGSGAAAAWSNNPAVRRDGAEQSAAAHVKQIKRFFAAVDVMFHLSVRVRVQSRRASKREEESCSQVAWFKVPPYTMELPPPAATITIPTTKQQNQTRPRCGCQEKATFIIVNLVLRSTKCRVGGDCGGLGRRKGMCWAQCDAVVPSWGSAEGSVPSRSTGESSFGGQGQRDQTYNIWRRHKDFEE